MVGDNVFCVVFIRRSPGYRESICYAYLMLEIYRKVSENKILEINNYKQFVAHNIGSSKVFINNRYFTITLQVTLRLA